LNCNIFADLYTPALLVCAVRNLGFFMVRAPKARKTVTREVSNTFPGATVAAPFLVAMLQGAAALAVGPSVHKHDS
jgi:hypothetical protein